MPDVEGALVAMDPHTGRVLALVGGFSYGKSQFNRAVQALRQPGSSFKPFVYAAALDNGYTPSSVVLDAPIEFKMSNGEIWKPKNYQNKFFGPSTLRRGIEQSRNVMTVRLANDLGMSKIADLAQRLGIYDKMPNQLAMALGAGETTLLRMTTAYSILDNGGKKIEATLIDRVQDRYGHTIFRHDKRDCTVCKAGSLGSKQAEPELFDVRPEGDEPLYRLSDHLDARRRRRTRHRQQAAGGRQAGCRQDRDVQRGARCLVHRLHARSRRSASIIGYDNPKPMGKGRTGGELAAPVVADFMQMALRDKPATPFRVPKGIELMPINVKTGQRDLFGEAGVILEAFKPGDEPPEDRSRSSASDWRRRMPIRLWRGPGCGSRRERRHRRRIDDRHRRPLLSRHVQSESPDSQMRAEIVQRRRRDEAVDRTAEEASLTGINAQRELAELNARAEDPSLWSDPQKAQDVMRKRQDLDSRMNLVLRLEQTIADNTGLIELGEAEGDQADRRGSRKGVWQNSRTKLPSTRLETLLSGEADANDAFLQVNAGAGGTESQDWASMLMRMYVRWAEQHDYKVEVLDEHAGEEAGIKSATLADQGPQRLWLAEDRIGRASAGAHFALRFECPPPHLICLGLGLSGRRRRDRYPDQ